ncbi:MAG: rod shape-determining protein RodA [Rhodospirillales bacterium]|nr:rod shape-determining protein RodA [Rhodospirillales bacterium]MDH3969032.1 rod shape-determining protein RodA [Rhodospirillales bacterium]
MDFTDLSSPRNPRLKFSQKLAQISWGLIFLVLALGASGVAMLYSAADGSMEPWASRQMVRLGAGLLIMSVVALFDIRFWFRQSYLIYLGALLLLVAVEVMGSTGMGAQRWIDLKVIRIQPSEVMKVALVMVLARYFHGLASDDIGRPTLLLLPLALVLVPTALVVKQPDLGTSAMLLMVGVAMFFIAGVRMWKFGVLVVAGLGAIPIGWQFLHGYQRQRVLTFLNPESDPLGSGYHTIQSKIALGSGGLTGRGFLQGTQTHLEFLPEKQTDFIFTMLAEEFGMLGGLGLLGLYTLVFVYGAAIAIRSRNHFGRLLAMGLMINLFLYVFINIAMVMGLIPVVGVPLPLISYGGTAMMTVLISLGLMMSISIHRDVRIPRTGLNTEL